MLCLLLLRPGRLHSLLGNVELTLCFRLHLHLVEVCFPLGSLCRLCLCLSLTALCQIHSLLDSRVCDRCSLVSEPNTARSRRGKLQSHLVRVSNLLLWANLSRLFLRADFTERLSGYIPYPLRLDITLHTASLGFSHRDTTEVEHALCTTELIRLNFTCVDAVARSRCTNTLSTSHKVRTCAHTTSGAWPTHRSNLTGVTSCWVSSLTGVQQVGRLFADRAAS